MFMSECILLCFWSTSTFTTYAQLGSLLRIALTILVLYNGSTMAVGQLWQLALTILVLYNDCSAVMIAHNAWHAHAYTHKTGTHAGTKHACMQAQTHKHIHIQWNPWSNLCVCTHDIMYNFKSPNFHSLQYLSNRWTPDTLLLCIWPKYMQTTLSTSI